MIYLIISLIFLVIAFGCFRNYSKGNIIPTCTYAFLASSVISGVIYAIDFKLSPEKHEYEAREINYDSGKLSFMGDKIKISGESVQYSKDLLVERDTVSYIKEIVLDESYRIPGMIDIVLEKNRKKILYLSERDYEIYTAFRDSLDKRN